MSCDKTVKDYLECLKNSMARKNLIQSIKDLDKKEDEIIIMDSSLSNQVYQVHINSEKENFNDREEIDFQTNDDDKHYQDLNYAIDCSIDWRNRVPIIQALVELTVENLGLSN
jgi:hypothetical protein